MLGLEGFVLLAVSQYAGELEQAIETTAGEAFYRGCGVQAVLHDRRPTWVPGSTYIGMGCRDSGSPPRREPRLGPYDVKERRVRRGARHQVL
jgi:hypothetical protein